MSKLDADQRNSMPKSEFALPGGRFPINDRNHAEAALSGASRAENVGNITPAQKSEIDAKAHAKLGLHPRQHSLAMASADTLHKAGYISDAHHKAIRGHAGKKLDAHKAAKESPAYGSLAPMDKQP
jgi:hypothetical protein